MSGAPAGSATASFRVNKERFGFGVVGSGSGSAAAVEGSAGTTFDPFGFFEPRRRPNTVFAVGSAGSPVGGAAATTGAATTPGGPPAGGALGPSPAPPPWVAG